MIGPSLSEINAATQVDAHRDASFYEASGKRVMDVVIALTLIPLIAPIVLILWLIIKRDGGTGFFGHTRIGQNGEKFVCWKLRSMCVDADVRLAEHLKSNTAAAAEWQRDFKLDADPRITRLGNFIRKTSLDELPQLWNVIKGEMSLVGPRPVVSAELARYGHNAQYYLAVRPGVTGAWQVSGRNDVTYPERVQMDVEYARSMSATKDLAIIAATAGAVWKRTGK